MYHLLPLLLDSTNLLQKIEASFNLRTSVTSIWRHKPLEEWGHMHVATVQMFWLLVPWFMYRFEALRGVDRYLEPNSLLVTKATSINGIHVSSWSTDLMAVSRRQEGALSFPSIFLVGNSWGTTFYAGNTNVDSVARCDVSWHNCFR